MSEDSSDKLEGATSRTFHEFFRMCRNVGIDPTLAGLSDGHEIYVDRAEPERVVGIFGSHGRGHRSFLHTRGEVFHLNDELMVKTDYLGVRPLRQVDIAFPYRDA